MWIMKNVFIDTCRCGDCGLGEGYLAYTPSNRVLAVQSLVCECVV